MGQVSEKEKTLGLRVLRCVVRLDEIHAVKLVPETVFVRMPGFRLNRVKYFEQITTQCCKLVGSDSLPAV